MSTASRQWNRSSKRLAALFLVVLVPSAATLIWLGARLLDQDRRLWADRDRERREAAAEIFVRELGQTLASIDVTPGGSPEGVVIAELSAAAVTAQPSSGVLWSPAPPHLPEASAQVFIEAEIAESRQTGDRGLGTYTSYSRSSESAIRAGALWRLARLHLTSGKVAEAINVYRQLADINGVAVNGMPVDLFARRQICRLLEESEDQAELAREAHALREYLMAGRWILDRTAWEISREDVERWTGSPLDAPPERQALTQSLEWLWQEQLRTNTSREAQQPVGRRVFRANDVSILVQWRTEGAEKHAVLVPPSTASRWARTAMPTELVPADSLLLTDDAGAIVVGTKDETATGMVVRLATQTGLPWNVAIKPPSSPASDPELLSRRRLLGAGLGAMVILLGGGGYLAWRTVQRELAVARLQTEFVAAVSHEFRTPLTSLQHVTELLAEDDELPPARKHKLYATLGRSTDRLRGLVESLLDFARMEEGHKPYDLQPLDPALLVQRVISEFERHASEETAIAPQFPGQDTLHCRADADALGHALWNLLDNAVKYSPSPHAVSVSVQRRGSDIAIAVADQGFGIPVRERQNVFRKFVRGSDTLRRGIKGTGLGLAIVSHIVAAHRGRIELDSEEGRGSTFTIVLPAA